MRARKVSDTAATPIQLSLRVRHPAIDPEHISRALGMQPEHSFKAGDARPGRSSSRVATQHLQTYWLAPIGPEALSAAPRDLGIRATEGVLLQFLQHLRAQHSFLQKIQAEEGDIALIMVVERESAADFTLPVSIARLLVELSISIEFKFDS